MERQYSGGFLYNPNTQEVLLHQRDAHAKVNPNVWAFFGGLSEGNETPKETFIREIHEELNIDVPEETVRLLCDYMNEELATYRHVFFVESTLEKSQMQLGEGKGFDWIPLAKVFDYDLTEKTRRDLTLFIEKGYGQ